MQQYLTPGCRHYKDGCTCGECPYGGEYPPTYRANQSWATLLSSTKSLSFELTESVIYFLKGCSK